MPKHYKRRASHRGFGGGGLAKHALTLFVGGVAGKVVAPMIPVNVPFKENLVGAVGGYLVNKTPMGAIEGAVAPAAADLLLGATRAGGSSSIKVYG